MKTKEIDVWIDPNDLNNKGSLLTVFEPSMSFNYKAKLIVEISEQEITITESQFDDAVESFYRSINNCDYCENEIYQHIKMKLGFKDD